MNLNWSGISWGGGVREYKKNIPGGVWIFYGTTHLLKVAVTEVSMARFLNLYPFCFILNFK